VDARLGEPLPIDRLAPPGALRLVQTSRSAGRLARWIAAGLPLLALLLILLPWQQTSTGAGRVVAYDPVERAQTVDAPIKGILTEWLVIEGEAVEEGQPLVEISDNDPGREERVRAMRDAALAGLVAAEATRDAYVAKREAALAKRDLAVAEIEARIAELQERRVGEEVDVAVSGTQDERVASLLADGLASTRDAELADLGRARAEATLAARDRSITAARAARDKARRDGDAEVAAAEADLQAAEAKIAEARAKVQEAETSVARFDRRLVRAPRAGVIHRIHGGPGGAQVSEGEVLLTLVPTTESRAVELYVDGNDVALVYPGDEVRLIFEGWPALQFPGMPGASAGTFAGRIAFLDATDDGTGKFRALVLPDPDAPAWPDSPRLRQGVRAKGFVLLGRVPLGYELWRQINGFPPLPADSKIEGPPLPTSKKPRAPGDLK
jgi:multidrug resistance efflux pump